MELNQRVTVDFDSESYYLDGKYWESWDNYGEEMADAINKEFNKLAEENEQLNRDIDEIEKDNERLEQITSQFAVGDIVNLKFANELIDEQRKTIRELKQKNDNLTLLSARVQARNDDLNKQISEVKTDEKQLSISFLGFKMKLIDVLQKKYDRTKGQTLYADVFLEIAEEMGVDLDD